MYTDLNVNTVSYLCELNNGLLKDDSWQFRRGIRHRLPGMTRAQLWRHSFVYSKKRKKKRKQIENFQQKKGGKKDLKK